MDYKKDLLNKLLDKFERSKSYLDMTSPRRVLLKLSANEYPEYDIEKPEIRELINSIIQGLDKKGLVGFEWLKFETGNIIEKVWLQLDKVDMVYREAGRLPKSDRASAILQMVKQSREVIISPWIRRFLDDVDSNIINKKSVTPFLPDNEEDAKVVLSALEAIDKQNNEERLERVFSLKCFGDSKFFEKNVKRKIIDVIKKYLLLEEDFIEKPSDDEILAQVGIVKAPEMIDFCGSMVGKLSGESIDFSIFKQGISINSYTVKELEILDLKHIQEILFIENKTNYVDYVSKKKKEEELVVYHGGFYSPAKALFFEKVYDIGKKQGISFYHWSDIDVGGFRIFNRLKTNIVPGLKPFLMDKTAFLSKREYWISFNEKYGNILQRMLEEKGFFEFHEVISAMLEVKARLEQEAFL